MDDALKTIIDAAGKRAVIAFTDPDAGHIRVMASATAKDGTDYTLKPLAELYGPGSGLDSIDTSDDTFMPLLLSIEESILDAGVMLSMDRLCTAPDSHVRADRVAQAVQIGLRMTLSLNDYSRQDVRHALRKVARSVARHTRNEGPRGYLTFIRAQLGG